MAASSSNASVRSLPQESANAGPLTASMMPFELTVALVMALALAFTLHVAEPDLWGHVQYGRDALTDGLATTTTYSYSAEGYPWVNHENLSELLFALGVDYLGIPGLLMVKCGLGLLMASWLIGLAVRRGAQPLVACATTLMVAMTLVSYWQMRPQLFSQLLYAILMGLLCLSFQEWEGSWRLPWLSGAWRDQARTNLPIAHRPSWLLWCVPPLFVIWVNAHGGFVAGLALLLACLLARAAEAFLTMGRGAYPALARMGTVGLVAVLATLLNPYGPRLHLWLIQAMDVPPPEITEWQPLSLASEAAPAVGLLAVVGLASLWGSRRSLDATQLLLLALTAWQASRHERHVPFFAILSGLVIPPHLQSLLDRMRRGSTADTRTTNAESTADIGQRILANRWTRSGIYGLLFLAALGLGLRMRQITVHRHLYPVSAVEFMARHHLGGRTVVTYNWAQYVIAALGRGDEHRKAVQVGFDGRFDTCYPALVLDQHFDFILGADEASVRRSRSQASGAPDPARHVREGNPELVLINRRQTPSVNVMQREAGWILLYQDQIAQLWGRSDRYDDQSRATYLPPAQRQISDAAQTGTEAWPALPRANANG